MIGCSQVKKASDHVPSNSIALLIHHAVQVAPSVFQTELLSPRKDRGTQSVLFGRLPGRASLVNAWHGAPLDFVVLNLPSHALLAKQLGTEADGTSLAAPLPCVLRVSGACPQSIPGALAALLIVLVFLSPFCTVIPQRDGVRYVNYPGCVGQVNTVQSLCIV